MRYIWCEDEGSGFYFWWLINKAMLDSKYKVVQKHGIANLVEEVSTILNDGNSYIICFDNSPDNIKLKPDIERLRKFNNTADNIVLVDYICFEQVVLSSDNIAEFFPEISNDTRYHIVRQHFAMDYTDTSLLEKLWVQAGNIKKYGTAERFFKPVLEDNCTVSAINTTRIVNGKVKPFLKKVMLHHYICKGAWSVCWLTDCVPDCPNKYCWKSEQDCIECNEIVRNHSCKKSESYNDSERKFEELKECSRELPTKLYDRVKLLFEKSIISNYIHKPV